MRRNFLKAGICLFLWLAHFPAAAQTVPHDRSAAVIFAYHRIGEDEYPENSVRQEQFAAHIRELASGGYNVMALPDIAAAFKNNEKLPERTVALTFDGGHKSIMDNAVPLLEENGLPYTLFIPADYMDRASTRYIGWSGLKNLSRSKLATVGMHPASYVRLHEESGEEITRQINKARTRFREELGTEPVLFAYPFGEYSKTYREIIEKQGFTAAFGQQSGTAWAGADMLALPRFPMTESYGGLDRFRLTANALPLPVTGIEPADPLLDTAAPSIGFTVDESLANSLENISCFISGQEKPEMEIIGGNRIELRLDKPLETDRARINCTLPLPAGEDYEDPRWPWFGLQLIVPKDTHQSWNTGTENPEQKDG